MNPEREMSALGRWLPLTLAGLVSLTACDGILDIDEAGIIVFEDLEAGGPSAIPPIVAGTVGLLTDEMILSGTFETRQQVDRRRILVNNGTLEGAVYTPLHRARMQADTTVDLLQVRLTDPAFVEVQDEIREGIALGKLYGGFSRMWLAELYCWSILTGMFPET